MHRHLLPTYLPGQSPPSPPAHVQDDFTLGAYYDMGQQLGSAARAPGLRPVSSTLGQHLIRMGCEEVAQLLQLLGFDRFDLRALKARRLTGGRRLRLRLPCWDGMTASNVSRLCGVVGVAGLVVEHADMLMLPCTDGAMQRHACCDRARRRTPGMHHGAVTGTRG
jgi:hypothetical protein